MEELSANDAHGHVEKVQIPPARRESFPSSSSARRPATNPSTGSNTSRWSTPLGTGPLPAPDSERGNWKSVWSWTLSHPRRAYSRIFVLPSRVPGVPVSFGVPAPAGSSTRRFRSLNSQPPYATDQWKRRLNTTQGVSAAASIMASWKSSPKRALIEFRASSHGAAAQDVFGDLAEAAEDLLRVVGQRIPRQRGEKYLGAARSPSHWRALGWCSGTRRPKRFVERGRWYLALGTRHGASRVMSRPTEQRAIVGGGAVPPTFQVTVHPARPSGAERGSTSILVSCVAQAAMAWAPASFSAITVLRTTKAKPALRSASSCASFSESCPEPLPMGCGRSKPR